VKQLGKDFVHSKFFKLGIIILIPISLLLGIVVPITMVNFSNELYLRIDGKGLNLADDKIILFIDVPDIGGKAIAHSVFVIKSKGLRDNWDFFDNIKPKETDFKVDLHSMDFIIIINSDSSGNGKWDDFSLKLTIPNSETNQEGKNYHFGDEAGNSLILGIWQLSHTTSLSLFNSGISIYYFDNSAPSTQYSGQYYDYTDWQNLWDYTAEYITSGDETTVFELLIDYDFPAPIVF